MAKRLRDEVEASGDVAGRKCRSEVCRGLCEVVCRYDPLLYERAIKEFAGDDGVECMVGECEGEDVNITGIQPLA